MVKREYSFRLAVDRLKIPIITTVLLLSSLANTPDVIQIFTLARTKQGLNPFNAQKVLGMQESMSTPFTVVRPRVMSP